MKGYNGILLVVVTVPLKTKFIYYLFMKGSRARETIYSPAANDDSTACNIEKSH